MLDPDQNNPIASPIGTGNGITANNGGLQVNPATPSNGMTTVSARIADSSQQGTSQGQNQQNNQYTPEQQAAQNQLLNQLMSYLSGGSSAPGWMTAPPEAFKAYNDAFNQYVAPGIATQYGAGSPQIGAQQMMGNEQLAANLYSTGISQWLSGAGALSNAAFTAVGQNTASQGQSTSNAQGSTLGVSDTTYGQSLLGNLLGLISP